MVYKLFDRTLEKIEGSVICVIDGKESMYSSIKELLSQEFTKKYEVVSIAAVNESIVITMNESSVIPNDLTEDWAKEHMANTGREISFF
jgi:hypothetical protein